ncbi:dnaJ homolog subfamily C member 28 [Lycorma delicatula]|uniref:dnaJ homolog subfamily C member 28 n=1 Tax=Lycorma delicatula TaxID=130591 RepID=UPI003F5135C8
MELVVKKLAVTTNLSIYDNFSKLLINSARIDGLKRNANICRYSTASDYFIIKKSYMALNIPEESDQETVRQAFVKLVKKYHPDSGSPEADPSKFREIESAYRKLQEKFSNKYKEDDYSEEYGDIYGVKKHNRGDVVEQDIEHTAPQHRQYLNYGGFGSGTPSQRERQYQAMRAETAMNNLHKYRVAKIQSQTPISDEEALVVKDRRQARKIKTRYGFDRLVEDLIQESMARGEFDNLAGQGKPLDRQFAHHNPYVDFVTHKLNQVLIENGFKPQWITLQKEIREKNDKIIQHLVKVRRKLGPLPLNEEDQLNWQRAVTNLEDVVKKHNNKIMKYNLVVPLLRKQMLQFDLKRQADKVLNEVQPQPVDQSEKLESQRKLMLNNNQDSILMSLILSIF